VFFVIGPLMVLAGQKGLLAILVGVWAYYHVIRQHYGFMVLYKKKNNDLAPVDNAIDRLLLFFAFNYPFVAFIARDPEAMARVPTALQAGVSALAMILLVGTVALGLVWIGRQLQRFISALPLDVPKYLLLAAAIPMHWIVLLTPMPHKPIAIVAILTIYHNLQYHRLIWFHNQKYCAEHGIEAGGTNAADQNNIKRLELRAALREKHGAAAFISNRLIIYISFGILFGILYQGPRQYLGYVGLRNNSNTLEQSLPAQLAIAFLWGYAFIHYYLDSKIWRVRRDPSVGQALKMS
jgi:hypothetical protein